MAGMPTTSWMTAAVLVVSQVLACCCAVVAGETVKEQPATDAHACCKSNESQPAPQTPVSHDPTSGGEGCPHCGSGTVKVAPKADVTLSLQLLESGWMPMLSVEAWSGNVAEQFSGFNRVCGDTGPPVAQTLRALSCLLLI